MRRNASRRRRRIRLRTTALPIFFVTVRPTRGPTRAGDFEPAVCLQCKRLELRAPPSRCPLKIGATGQSPPIGAFGRRSPCRLVQGVGPADRGEGRADPARMAVRPTGACGRARGGRSELYDRRPFPCVRETHVGVCERVCSVDRSASRLKLQSLPATRRRRSRATSQPGPRLAAISSREAIREKFKATENRAGGL